MSVRQSFPKIAASLIESDINYIKNLEFYDKR